MRKISKCNKCYTLKWQHHYFTFRHIIEIHLNIYSYYQLVSECLM